MKTTKNIVSMIHVHEHIEFNMRIKVEAIVSTVLKDNT